MSKFIIAGIGSRKTPEMELEILKEIAQHVVNLNGWIRSGHADGADMAFEEVAKDRCIAYLPWHGFNGNLLTRHFCVFDDAHPAAIDRALLSVIEFHPNYDSIKNSQGIMKIMQRNYFQIYGAGEEEHPIDAVVCWAPSDPYQNIKGGTGQACRIANYNDIPIFNLYSMKKKFVIDCLSELARNKEIL